MKKLMIGLVTLTAVVGATVLPATAGEWFNGGVAEGWPKAESLSGGAWTNTETAVFADGAVAFTNTSASALTFAATTAAAPGGCPATIDTSVVFTPRTTLPVPTAKAGVISYGNCFYVLAKDPGGTTNIWTNTEIAATPTASMVIEFPSATKVTYKIGDSSYGADIASAESIQNVKFSGIGTISSLAGAVATVKVTTVKVTTNDLEVAGTTVAVTVGGAPLPADGMVPTNSNITVTWTAKGSDVYFMDGKTTYTQEFEASKDVNPVSEAVTVPSAPMTPTLSLGVVAQRYPWDGKIDIQYMAKNTPNDLYEIEVKVKVEGVEKTDRFPAFNGKNQVTFDALEKFGEVQSKNVKVTAKLEKKVE